MMAIGFVGPISNALSETVRHIPLYWPATYENNSKLIYTVYVSQFCVRFWDSDICEYPVLKITEISHREMQNNSWSQIALRVENKRFTIKKHSFELKWLLECAELVTNLRCRDISTCIYTYIQI